jgi:hypothetical protein
LFFFLRGELADIVLEVQIAMMGGSMGDTAPGQGSDAEAGSGAGTKAAQRGAPSKAMGVQEFLAKGGGAQLPRQQQAKKEREKSKRMRGQSSHQVWKSEAEMVLRQQYDS